MTGPTPLISVVIPLYNKERWVTRCLASIRAQTFTDYEIIVVDDGSTDGSPKIAKQFLTNRDQFISQPNAGPGAARNRGIAAARGAYLAFIDADDEWVPEFLERAAAAFGSAEQACDVVSQSSMALPEGLEHGPHASLRDRLVRLGPSASLIEATRVVGLLGVGRIVVRAPLVRRLGGFYDADRVTMGEDTWLWCRLVVCASIYADPRVGLINHTDAGELCGSGRVRTRDTRLPPEVRSQRLPLADCPAELRPVLRALVVQASLTTGVRLLLHRRWRLALPLLARALPLSVAVPTAWLTVTKALAARLPGAAALRRRLHKRPR